MTDYKHMPTNMRQSLLVKASMVPKQWIKFQRVFSAVAGELTDGGGNARRKRRMIKERLAEFQKQIEAEIPWVGVSEHIPESLASGIRKAIDVLRQQQLRLLNALGESVEAFESAEENEDRFVVLVFGEVNAGKSTLANHVAGLDFEASASSPRGESFVGDDSVNRLAEWHTECTRHYQGFRLPGLLWIDCPGILSSTEANAKLARRLVARADFLVFLSNSDAPFKASEMAELSRIIKESGQDKVDACLVVTRADYFDIDEDPVTGREIRRVVIKDRSDRKVQAEWCREQLSTTSMGRHLRIQEPIALSVFVARDALGRRWDDGSYFRAPDENWEVRYRTSGLPDLLKMLADLATEEGPKLKAAWPKKRAAALHKLFGDAADKSIKDLKQLAEELECAREKLTEAKCRAVHLAAELASGQVEPCLKRNGIYKVGGFSASRGQEELRDLLYKSVKKASESASRDILKEVRKNFDAAFSLYVQKTEFSLDVEERFKTHTIVSTKKGEGYGKALVGVGGGAAGAAIGTAIFPGVGTVIGGIVGGILGGWSGRKLGKILKDNVEVKVSAGTNAAEVIASTRKQIETDARRYVKKVFADLDTAVFGQILGEIGQLQLQVKKWSKVNMTR